MTRDARPNRPITAALLVCLPLVAASGSTAAQTTTHSYDFEGTGEGTGSLQPPTAVPMMMVPDLVPPMPSGVSLQDLIHDAAALEQEVADQPPAEVADSLLELGDHYWWLVQVVEERMSLGQPVDAFPNAVEEVVELRMGAREWWSRLSEPAQADPDAFDWARYGRALTMAGYLADEVADYEAALDLNELVADHAPGTPAGVAAALYVAERASNGGEYAVAEMHFRHVAESPDMALARYATYRLAWTLYNRGDIRGALAKLAPLTLLAGAGEQLALAAQHDLAIFMATLGDLASAERFCTTGQALCAPETIERVRELMDVEGLGPE